MKLNSPTLSEKAIYAEEKIQRQLRDFVDQREKVLFDAGAGSGKTYSLIECLRHILINYSKELHTNNQKVLCVTYTNVAVDEIKRRLGNSDLIYVSTIHDLLWSIIGKHQSQLIDIHKKKLIKEANEFETRLSGQDKEYKVFKDLSDSLQEDFRKDMLENRDIFYQTYNMKAKDVRDNFGGILARYPNVLKNIGNFRKIGTAIYKIFDYNSCLNSIDHGDDGYLNIAYDSRRNRDSLHRMRISHDTVLEYAFQIISSYDVLKQICIDCYPYILVDEYQDTAPELVQILKMLDDYSTKIDHPIFIGYFGDHVQNIYDKGVGGNIIDLHPSLNSVNKDINRRSFVEIINTINEIRHDKIRQYSIYENYSGGSVRFYYSSEEDKLGIVRKFINKYEKKWLGGSDDKIHCLVLTNKLLAELSGFEKVYSVFYESKYYKTGRNYELLKTDLLSHQREKLGDVPALLFKILDFRKIIFDEKSIVSQLVSANVASALSFTDLKHVVLALQQTCGNSLCEYMYSMFSVIDDASEELRGYIVKVLSQFIDVNSLSFRSVYDYILGKLNPELDYDDDNELMEAKEHLDYLLEIDISEWDKWHNYVSGLGSATVNFHTYHGTKGEEYENVLIFMENSFGREKEYFSCYFKDIEGSGIDTEDERRKYEATKNLLYVSCSRAVKNLRILYLDDIAPFKNGVESVFLETTEFSIQEE
ncbi:UvrD-helicase domain-containing protein [Maridesulfovibrio sp.]|uniref:UvrD-helicase domain-containing protein n=1 Tax=Maridesulfovibrio sp. TaxID=2795000 RepID=UPI002AA7D3C7|nr:UvrD-helicase domain-containing protein [Maridesulfovibrio sp.]